MSDFKEVERPAPRARGGPRKTGLAEALRQTADSGKAIVLPERSAAGISRVAGHRAYLKRSGYEIHEAKQADGTYLGWCERIAPTNGHA